MFLPGCDAILDLLFGVTRAMYTSAIYVSYIYGETLFITSSVLRMKTKDLAPVL